MTGLEILDTMSFTRINEDGESEDLIGYEWAKLALEKHSAELQRKIFQMDFIIEACGYSREQFPVLWEEADKEAGKTMKAIEEAKEIHKNRKQ